MATIRSAPSVQKVAPIIANRNGMPSALSRSSAVGDRSSTSHCSTGALIFAPQHIPRTSVTAR